MSAASLKANEPSMEEILASIRRIIADDTGKTSTALTPQPLPEPASDEPEDDDVLDLALVAPEPLVKPVDLEPLPPMSRSTRTSSSASSTSRSSSAKPRTRAGARAAARAPRRPRRLRAPSELQEDETAALAAGRMRASPPLSSPSPPPSCRRTPARSRILVKDMMRPMLKSWLDENLPGAGRAAGQGRDRASIPRPTRLSRAFHRRITPPSAAAPALTAASCLRFLAGSEQAAPTAARRTSGPMQEPTMDKTFDPAAVEGRIAAALGRRSRRSRPAVRTARARSPIASSSRRRT